MTEKKRILFVDDEPDILKLIAFKLRKEGYEVITAQDGEEALQLAQDSPNLVLLDLWLPGIDGYEVARRIKTDARLKDIPIILFTASGSNREAIAKNVFELGVQDYIIKPFKSEELLEKIKRYIT